MDYNPFETYFIDQSQQNKLSKDIICNLSSNPSISINALIEICTNCNVNFKNYIINNPNLTIDDVEQHNLSVCDYALNTIGHFYDIFHDNRITFTNSDFYYKDHVLGSIVVYNKHLTYEIFKSYEHINDISNNEYIFKNPNGNIIHYDFTNFEPCEFYYYEGNYDNNFEGIYDNNFEEFIIKNKTVFMNNIDFMQRYLSYDFIQNNLDLFRKNDDLYYNNSLTINNVLNIIKNKISVFTSPNVIFKNANITLDEIINNNLHNHKCFHYYASNRNCTVNDILTHSDLNWNLEELNEHLSINRHDYNKYIFKFIN
jgi:hypothetical protein